MVDNVVGFFIDKMTEEFYEANKEFILFAISVDSIECWLLPFYFTDNKKSKTTNCLATLNTVLPKQKGFTISAKEPKYYRSASEICQKNKSFLKMTKENPSLHVFINNLTTKNIVIKKEEDW